MANLSGDRFAFSASGTFRCMKGGERLKMIVLLTALLLLLGGNVLFAVRQFTAPMPDGLLITAEDYRERLVASSLSLLPTLLCISAAELLAYHFLRTLIFRDGDEYRWFADETMFTCSCPKNGKNISVKYENVLYVRYDLFRSLWYRRGYLVTVALTGGEMHEFHCIAPGKGARISSESLPFRIIEERVEKMRREKREENFGGNLC